MKLAKSLLPIMLVMMLVLAGCSSGGSRQSADNGYGSAPAYDSVQSDYESSGQSTSDSPGSSTVASTADRKVIFTYEYDLETTEMDETLLALEKAVSAVGGYIENANYYGRGSNDQYSRATLTCRVPVGAVEGFKDVVEAAGHVTNRSEHGSDVTDEYFDIEARLTVLHAQEDRLLELLEMSGSLTDLLEIERELARVRTEIEQLTGKLQKLDNLVDLATFTITVYNVSEYSPAVGETFLARLGRSVSDSLDSALSVAQDLLIGLVYLLPYLLVAGLVLLVLLVVHRRRRRARLAEQSSARALQPEPASQLANPDIPTND